MKNISTILMVSLALIAGGCKDTDKAAPKQADSATGNASVAKPPAPTFKLTTLISKAIEPAADQSLSWDNKVFVTVPAGALKSKEELRISSIDAPPPNRNKLLKQIAVFDISLGDKVQPDKPVTIEIAYDAPRKKGTYVFMSYWDLAQDAWVVIPAEVDYKKKVIRGRTDHLCPVSIASAEAMASAQDKDVAPGDVGKWYYANEYFLMVFDRNEVFAATCSDSEPRGFKGLIDPSVPVLRLNNPAYPEQIWHYANNARTKYYADGSGFRDLPRFEQGAIFDSAGTTIFPTGQGSSARNKYTGNVTVTLGWNGWMGLRHDVSHELFHQVQNRYFTCAGMTARKWWIEATADYAADIIAFGGSGCMGGESVNPRFLDVPLMYTSSFIYDTAQGAAEAVAESVNLDRQAILKADPHGLHEYSAAFFIDFLVKRKGIDFKDLFEFVATYRLPDVSRALEDYFKSKGTSTDECHQEFARWWCFDPQSPLYTRGLIKDLKQMSEPQSTDLLPAAKKNIEQTLGLPAGRTGKLWCFKLEADRAGKTRPIAISVQAKFPNNGTSDLDNKLPASGWKAYVYVLKNGEMPKATPTPLAVLDPGPTGETARTTAPLDAGKDDLVCVLAVSENLTSHVDVTIQAGVDTTYRSARLSFLATGDSDRNPPRESGNTASLGTVRLMENPVVLKDDTFAISGTTLGWGLPISGKVQCTGRFSKDRQMIEEMTIAWNLDGKDQQGGISVKEQWTVKLKNVPHSRLPDKYMVFFQTSLKDEKGGKAPPGFEIISSEYQYERITTLANGETTTDKASGVRNFHDFKLELTFSEKPPTTQKSER